VPDSDLPSTLSARFTVHQAKKSEQRTHVSEGTSLDVLSSSRFEIDLDRPGNVLVRRSCRAKRKEGASQLSRVEEGDRDVGMEARTQERRRYRRRRRRGRKRGVARWMLTLCEVDGRPDELLGVLSDVHSSASRKNQRRESR